LANVVNEIGIVITEVLNSTEASSVEKLVNLNKNSYLNSYLINKDYRNIASVVIDKIEDTTEEEVNKNVLKFYLHELGLIFNVNYSNFVEGIV